MHLISFSDVVVKNVSSINRYAVAGRFQQRDMGYIPQNPDDLSSLLGLPGPSHEVHANPAARGHKAFANVSNSATVSPSNRVGLYMYRMFAGAVFNGPVYFYFHRH